MTDQPTEPRKAALTQIQVIPDLGGPVIYALDTCGNLWMSAIDFFGNRSWSRLDNPSL